MTSNVTWTIAHIRLWVDVYPGVINTASCIPGKARPFLRGWLTPRIHMVIYFYACIIVLFSEIWMIAKKANIYCLPMRIQGNVFVFLLLSEGSFIQGEQHCQLPNRLWQYLRPNKNALELRWPGRTWRQKVVGLCSSSNPSDPRLHLSHETTLSQPLVME